MIFSAEASLHTQERLKQIMIDVGGELAPFDPYLHWSLNRRTHFLPLTAASMVAQMMSGLYAIEAQNTLYLARKFLNSSGWFWACVPIVGATSDDRMLLSMMDGMA
jgi:hypothetical protein